MESLKTLKFSKLNVKKFTEYLSSTDINEKEVIDFESGRLVSKSHSKLKTFIKFVEINTNDIFEGLEQYEHVYFPINNVSKMIKVFELYTSNNHDFVSGDIQYTEDLDGNYVASIMNIKAGKLKNKLILGEFSSIQYMKTSIWETIVSEVSKASIVFNLTSLDITNILKLLAIDRDTELLNKTKDFAKFTLKYDNKKLLISSFENKWEYAAEDVEILTETNEIHCFDIMIKLLDKTNSHKISIYKSSRGIFMSYIEEINLEKEEIEYGTKPKKYLVSCDVAR